MEYNAINTLTIQLESDEIDAFLTLFSKLKTEVKMVGFKKPLTSGEKLLIDDIYEKLLGNEEDIN